MPASTRPANVHPLPDARAGERVPLQPLPDPATEDRNCARPVSDRAADQNLVPKSPDEAEEGTAGGEGDQRTGAARTGRAGQDEERLVEIRPATSQQPEAARADDRRFPAVQRRRRRRRWRWWKFEPRQPPAPSVDSGPERSETRPRQYGRRRRRRRESQHDGSANLSTRDIVGSI